MNNSIDGVTPKFNIQKVAKTYECHDNFSQTNLNIPIPKTKAFSDKICENCDKEDVCKYKEECMKAVQDILAIEDRVNVFIKTHIDCKKWSKKSPAINMNDVLYR